ncbi:hypothetical protein UFOVP1382_70 [uncultured Caudovirales phage]|uniref:Uncharacterized protein n=1 Tax=uncultured Caudovirales phage TaxID=2100421 RepID=A0A6J5RXV0_9CAUD|nr:hypothetical protein UFOVP1382_70 [uncultured Caudovirales phage]
MSDWEKAEFPVSLDGTTEDGRAALRVLDFVKDGEQVSVRDIASSRAHRTGLWRRGDPDKNPSTNSIMRAGALAKNLWDAGLVERHPRSPRQGGVLYRAARTA